MAGGHGHQGGGVPACHDHLVEVVITYRGLPGALTWPIGRLLPQAMAPTTQARPARMLPLKEPPILLRTQDGYTV